MLQAAARRGRRATWVNVGLAVAVVAAGVAAYLSVRDPGTATTTADRTATVRTGSVTASVTGSGNLTSAATVGVSFATGGTLTRVDVKVGQVVKPGQKLAAIDPATLQTGLDSAQAQLSSAQASYDQTAAGATTYQRQKDSLAVASAQAGVDSAQAALTTAKTQLASDTTSQNAAVAAARAALAAGTGTQAQVDAAVAARTQTLAKDNQSITSANQQVASAKNQLAQQKLTQQQDLAGATAAQLAQAKAALQSAQNAVSTARSNLGGATLVAPVGGTVVSVAGVVGQSVSGSSSGSSGSGSSGSGSSGSGSSGTGSSGTGSSPSSTTGFVVLADLTRLQVTANIAEADIASVKVGEVATVTLSASNTQTDGTVTAIAVQPTTTNNVVTYPVTVTLDQPPEQARLGASVTISITTGSADNVLVAPTSAVTTLGQRHTVTLRKNGADTVTPVQVGLVGDNGTEITGGLSDGDVLVLPTTTSTTGNGFPRIGGVGGLGGRG